MAVFEPSEPFENRSKPLTAARKRLLSQILDEYDGGEDGTILERLVAIEEAINTAFTGILARLDSAESRLDALEGA